MKALDLPLAQLADLSDPYLAELAGRAHDAEPLRRRWLRQAQQDGDGLREALARARLGVNLVVQGAHRFALSELVAAQSSLDGWAASVPRPEAAWQLAVVAAAQALAEAQLSVRVEPARDQAAAALLACAMAVRDADPPADGRVVRDVLPWALAAASTWLTLLDEPSPAAWGEVLDGLDPVLRPALEAADPDAAEWLLRFASRIGALGVVPAPVRSALVDHLIALSGSAWMALDPLQRGESAPMSRLAALARARGLPDPVVGMGDPMGPGSIGQADPGLIERLTRLSRLARTPRDRQRLAGAWMAAAQRLDPPRSRQSTRLPAAARADAADLRLAAARLWAQDGHWPSVIDALILAQGQTVDPASARHADWMAVVHQLATALDARTARDRARRRTAALRKWLEQAVPAPLDEVDEARWLADLATLQGRDAEALALRRAALACAERERGAEALDTLLAMQALRDTLAERDPGHPELEDLHDAGVQLAQRLCGPMSPEHWWWRGMRALWWHRLGHPQALLDAGEEAEEALLHTVRSGDADTCACLRALLDMARALALPARSEAAGGPARIRVQ